MVGEIGGGGVGIKWRVGGGKGLGLKCKHFNFLVILLALKVLKV